MLCWYVNIEIFSKIKDLKLVEHSHKFPVLHNSKNKWLEQLILVSHTRKFIVLSRYDNLFSYCFLYFPFILFLFEICEHMNINTRIIILFFVVTTRYIVKVSFINFFTSLYLHSKQDWKTLHIFIHSFFHTIIATFIYFHLNVFIFA